MKKIDIKGGNIKMNQKEYVEATGSMLGGYQDTIWASSLSEAFDRTNLSCRDIAKYISYSPEAVKGWLEGKNKPNPEAVFRMCGLLIQSKVELGNYIVKDWYEKTEIDGLEDLANWSKEYRVESGLTRQDLASQLEVDVHKLGVIERINGRINKDTYHALVNFRKEKESEAANNVKPIELSEEEVKVLRKIAEMFKDEM